MAQDKQQDLLQGTLDLLILKAVSLGPLHGYGVLLRIQQISGRGVGDSAGVAVSGALPAWSTRARSPASGARAKTTAAKYYRLTAAWAGRLGEETENWKRMSGIIDGILKAT